MRETRQRNLNEQTAIDNAYLENDAIALEDWIDNAAFIRNRELAAARFVDLRLTQLNAADCPTFEEAFAPRPVTATNMKGEEWTPSTIVTFAKRAPQQSRGAIVDAILGKAADCQSPRLFSRELREALAVKDDSKAWASRLARLEKEGRLVHDAFLAFLQAGDVKAIDTDATFRWMMSTKTAAHCRELDSAAATNDTVRGFLLDFYAAKGCVDESIPTARMLVGADSPKDRRRACEAMRVLGNTSLLPQMAVLARTDPAREIDRSRGASVTYPVRESCQHAIKELRSKNRTTSY